MTEDKALIGSVKSGRGSGAKGRILQDMSNRHERRRSTARFAKYVFSDYLKKENRIEYGDRSRCIEFLVGDRKVLY